jgi:RND family efflux transporter MFP subunit
VRTKHERLNSRFLGARSATIRWLSKAGIISARSLVLAAVILVIPKLLAVQWIVNSQSAAQTETNAVVTATLQTVTNQFVAYARVEPIAVLPVRSVQAGVVQKIGVVPGTVVLAGQKLAELSGPEVRALLATDEATENSARTNLYAARKSLAIERQQLASHLVTQQALLQSESTVAQAQSAFDTAQAQLQALQETIHLKAPTDGIVLAVNIADGQRVSAGETILTLQPADKLWLKAAYYGNDVADIHAGISGEFAPAGDGEPIPVKVATVFSALNPDGGEAVGLLADTPKPGLPRQNETAAGWLNGQFGTVTLKGSVRQLVAVPTRALILDGGHWWVLVHTGKGDHRQEVIPGPARGWQTFLERGLQPGVEVVAENAYLEFHRGISSNYAPPD